MHANIASLQYACTVYICIYNYIYIWLSYIDKCINLASYVYKLCMHQSMHIYNHLLYILHIHRDCYT